MAYAFASASSQYLFADLVVGVPVTLAVWARPTTTASSMTLLTRNAANDDRCAIVLVSSGGVLNPRASFIKDGVASATATNTGFTASANEWVHVAGVFVSTSERTVYANGANATTDTTSVSALDTSERLQMGAARATAGQPSAKTVTPNMTGDLAEAAVWSAALNASEIASLGQGVSPRLIRPQSLVFYAPLIRDLIDVRGGLAITNNNTATVANHPRVYA